MTGFFVTGTDTGVGKTYVTAALARRARARGLRVFGFKPIETGCAAAGDDQTALCAAAGEWQTGLLRGVYQLAAPVAPLVAAAAEARTLDLDLILEVFAMGARASDVALVEGAGGWRVPITETADMAELARRLGLPVIVVARATLGTINHTLLTIEAVERDGCRIGSVVLSRRPEDDPAFARSNADQIGRRWSGPLVVFDGPLEALDVCFT